MLCQSAFFLVAAVLALASAFSPQYDIGSTRHNVCLKATRRDVLGAAVLGSLGGLEVAPVWADVDDLSMPTAEEQKAAEKAALEAKLKRKAELQKAASTPRSFSASFKGEMAKQKELSSQTKEQRRAALCEELGRGC